MPTPNMTLERSGMLTEALPVPAVSPQNRIPDHHYSSIIDRSKALVKGQRDITYSNGRKRRNSDHLRAYGNATSVVPKRAHRCYSTDRGSSRNSTPHKYSLLAAPCQGR